MILEDMKKEEELQALSMTKKMVRIYTFNLESVISYKDLMNLYSLKTSTLLEAHQLIKIIVHRRSPKWDSEF